MSPQVIRQQLSRAGSFLIRTSDGKQYPIPHPEFVLVGRRNVVVEQPNGLLDIIDPIHIVSIRPSRQNKDRRS